MRRASSKILTRPLDSQIRISYLCVTTKCDLLNESSDLVIQTRKFGYINA